MFLTGHALGPVEAVEADIRAAGGAAEAAQVDALDEDAIDEHLQSVIERAGRLDISFNAVGIPDAGVVGVPLVDSMWSSSPGRSTPTRVRTSSRHAWRRDGCRRRGRV